MENLKEDYFNLKHKTLFFFMPKHVVFAERENGDNISVSLIKSITPCFYWCSAHEFITNAENKFLIQHQIYFINGDDFNPSTIYQHWSKSKTSIRGEILKFLDVWPKTHEKILSLPSPTEKNINLNNVIIDNSKNKILNFSEFAHFVAKSIFKMKDQYINETKLMNIDFIQKECWKQIALDSKLSKDAIKFYFNNDVNTLKNKTKTNKTKTGKAKACKTKTDKLYEP